MNAFQWTKRMWKETSSSPLPQWSRLFKKQKRLKNEPVIAHTDGGEHSSFPCWKKHKLQPFNLLRRMPPCKVSSELFLIHCSGGKWAFSVLNVDFKCLSFHLLFYAEYLRVTDATYWPLEFGWRVCPESSLKQEVRTCQKASWMEFCWLWN